jgi:hypothetical protein
MEEKIFNDLKKFVEQETWVFAKTMKDKPHAYVTRWKTNDKEMFKKLSLAIRHFGVEKPFFSIMIRYLEIGEYHYWNMDKDDADPRLCNLINRAEIKNVYND